MNRELRRLTEREERRQKKVRQARGAPQRRRPGRPGERKSLPGRVVQFLREVRMELRRVSWPTRDQLVAFSVVTVITSAALTIYIFGSDFVLKRGILYLLELGS